MQLRRHLARHLKESATHRAWECGAGTRMPSATQLVLPSWIPSCAGGLAAGRNSHESSPGWECHVRALSLIHI
eukprot:7816677-Alexandrium_andersonii.AAC.1